MIIIKLNIIIKNNKYSNTKTKMETQQAFIMIQEKTGQRVYPAKPYQAKALNDYITNNRKGKYLYINYIDSTIKFHISEFDKLNLQGNYDDFYSLIREDGTISTMSRNENKLRNFTGYINRIISYE